jgi:argininosuccinate lyase
LSDATFDVAVMRRRATESWITATELADTLTRERGLPFSQSHAIAAAVVRAQRDTPGVPLSEALAESSARIAGRAATYGDEELRELLSPEHFVRVRRTIGGPAPEVTEVAVEESRAHFARDREWLAGTRKRLSDAEALLNATLTAL